MLLLDLFEARDKKKTYHEKEVKGKVEAIIVKLEGAESARYTKMANRYKEIDAALKKLQDERNDMNDAIKKDIVENYFDAADEIYTRVIETVSLTAQLAKTPKASPKVDNDAVVDELLKLMPQLKEQIEGLQKQFTSIPKPKAGALSIKTNEGVIADVWGKIKKKSAEYYNSVMSWAKGYDAKLAKIKDMMKPSRQVQETVAKTRALAMLAAKMQADKKQIAVKKFIRKLKASPIPLADVNDVIKDLDGKDGDTIIKAAEILKLPTVAKSANPLEFIEVAGLEESVAVTEGVRETFTKDLDLVERNAVSAIEKKLGKKIGEVSKQQVLDVLNTLYPNKKLGNNIARYKEFVADLDRAYKKG